MKTTFYDFIRTYDKYFFLFVFQNGESYSDSDSRNTYRQHYNIDFPVGSKIFTDSGGYLKSYRVQPDPEMSSYWTIVSLDDIYVKFNSLDSLDVSIYEFGRDGNVVVVYTENDEQTNQVERCMTTLTRDCGYKDKKDVVQWLWDFIKREDLESFDGVKLDDFCVQHDAGPTVLLNTIQWLNDFNWYDRSKVNVYLNMNFGRFNLTLRDLGVNYVIDDKSSYVEEVKNYFGNDAKVEFKPSSNGYWGNVPNPSNLSFDRPGFIDIDYETDIVQNITNSRRNNMFRKNVNVIKSDYCSNYGKRTIKSAVDGGWEVKSSEVPEALDMFVEYFGEETAVDEIARSMGTDTLNDNLDWVIRQWGFAEDVEDMDDPWDKYEYAKEVMGVHELFVNLTQAAGYDELAEDLAFIFRQYDFREWDERNGIESSRKPIKSSVVEWSNSRWIAYVDDMRLFEKECQKRGISDFNNLDEFINFLKEIGFVWGDGSGHYFISPNHINSSEGYDPKTGRKIQPMGDDYQNWVDFANEHNVADLDYFGKVVFGDYGYKNPESNLPLDELNYDLKRYEKIKRYNNEEPFTMMSSRKPIKSSDKPWEGKKWDIYRPGVDEPYVTEDFDEMMRFRQEGFKVKLHKEEPVKSSRKPIKSSYDDAFTVYPWDSERVTPTSDEDLGLSYAVEVYGDEFVNVSDDELDAMKDTLARYFDEDAFVRDWNINASGDDEKIDSFYDVYSDPDELDIEQLSRYFDYDAFGRDIRLEYNMVWDKKRECWFSARDVDSFENEDDIVFLGNSRKQVKSGRYDEVDPHAVEDLYLTTINDGEIYHRFIMPTIENLRKHNRRGQYDRNKAMISWMRVADEGAKQYDRDFGSGRGSVTMFSPATRKKVAEKMASYYEENVMEGAVESSRKIGSSTYKVFPTENEDTYQYYPFNDDIEADEFCKRNGYTHYEKVNDRSFEDDFDNIIREF